MSRSKMMYFEDVFINIKKANSEGLAYPDFLLDHILSEWQDVQIDLIDNRNECLFSVGGHKDLSSDNYLKGFF